MRNPQIQQLIMNMLEGMVQPSLEVLSEGLTATKCRAFVTEGGAVLYTEPEPDHRVRTATATRILDRYQRALEADLDGSAEGLRHQDTLVELPTPPASNADAGQHGVKDVPHLDPADRDLVRRAEEIDGELARLDDAPHDDGRGDAHSGEGHDH